MTPHSQVTSSAGHVAEGQLPRPEARTQPRGPLALTLPPACCFLPGGCSSGQAAAPSPSPSGAPGLVGGWFHFQSELETAGALLHRRRAAGLSEPGQALLFTTPSLSEGPAPPTPRPRRYPRPCRVLSACGVMEGLGLGGGLG